MKIASDARIGQRRMMRATRIAIHMILDTRNVGGNVSGLDVNAFLTKIVRMLGE